MLARACQLTLVLALTPSPAAAAAPDIDLSRAPAFVRADPRVVERLDDLLAAARGATPLARPPAPSPCNATDSGDRIRFTWTDVAGEEGYYLYRDGKIAETVPPNTTSFEEAPGPSTHSYCVIAYNSDGISDPCCETGTQTKLSTPSSCQLTGQPPNVRYVWTAVPLADGYRVYIDGTLFATVTAPTTFLNISPDPDPHDYCVEAFAAGAETSDRCCQTIQSPVPPLAPAPCTASDDLPGSVALTWTDVAGESGYSLSRDSRTVKTFPPNTTSYTDVVFGVHEYCVYAFNPYGYSPQCCSYGKGIQTASRLRLSWGTCSPQIHDRTFTGPAVYTLVLSVTGAPGANVGHDTQMRIFPVVPDAWRFDPGGCQTDSRLDLRNDALGDSCPAMLGANPLSITDYSINLDGSAALRLAVVYDDFATDPNTRYVLWQIGFDHTHTVEGSDSDPSTCDGGLVPLDFSALTDLLQSGGQALSMTLDLDDQLPTWNGGVVPARKTTWGHVKDLYR